MGYLFDPDNWGWITEGNNARFILEGFAINVEIALAAMVFSLIVGLLLALLSLAKAPPLAWAARMWIDVFRNLPLIFLILYLALAMPPSWREFWEDIAPGFFPEALENGRVLAALVALVLYNSAVLAEIMRAGIQSLDRGQGEAASALGLSYAESMRLVILPQGLRRMVPATVSQLITLNKDTTLVSIIGIQEVVRHARIVSSGNVFVGGANAPVLQVFLFIGALFIITNLLLSRLSRRLELREQERSGTRVEPVSGLEDQVALQADTR
jgi:His/Glu/Gln/Arg/opine family amino acid ABC transporter permease subunit